MLVIILAGALLFMEKIVAQRFNKFIYLFTFLILFLCTFYIWGFQSRMAFFGVILIFFFLLLSKINLKKKFISIIFFFIIPILSFEILNYYKTNNYYEAKTAYHSFKKEHDISKKNSEDKFIKNNRLLVEKENYTSSYITSGRSNLWSKSINYIFKSPIIGYGPQADRYLFKDAYFNINEHTKLYESNSSNALIYSSLCAGVFGFVINLLIYLLVIKEILIKIIKNNIIRTGNILTRLSFFTLIFLIFRSIVENSFMLFSLDFLLMLISYNILIYEKNKTT
jgi:hypothetical protein